MRDVTPAQDRIRLAYESLQVRAPGEKLYVAYSGGKDSECIAQLCKDSVGVDAMEVHYNATGIDPPELVKHVKEQFRAWESMGIVCHFDKPGANMHDLIVKNGLPRKFKRFCCEALKEGGGAGRVVIMGVRWAESTKRAANHDVLTVMSKHKELRATYSDDNDIARRIVEHCTMRSRITINPIIDWSNGNVWNYIHKEQINYCSLYDEGFTRLGCIGCPMATTRHRSREFARWPHMERYYRKAIAANLTIHPEYGDRYGWHTVDDVWHWWLEDGIIPGQTFMDFENDIAHDGQEGEG